MAMADVFDALTSDRVYRKRVLRGGSRGDDARAARPALRPGAARRTSWKCWAAAAPTRARRSRPTRRRCWRRCARTTHARWNAATRRSAEGAIAQAIEDGIAPGTMHAEVIEPALRRIGELRDAGELDEEAERRAMAITARHPGDAAALHARRQRPGRRAGARPPGGSVRAIEQRLSAREPAVG